MTSEVETLLKSALDSNNVVWLKEHAGEYDIDSRIENDDNDTLSSYAICNGKSNCNSIGKIGNDTRNEKVESEGGRYKKAVAIHGNRLSIRAVYET